MKEICKIAKYLFVAAIVFCIIGILSIPIVNDWTAKKVEQDLLELSTPEDTVVIDSISKAGKFTGNGNGMQYFGAILVKSELSIDELDVFYEEFRDDEWDCIVVNQKQAQSDFFGYNDELRFSKYDEEKGDFFIIYSWGDGISPFDILDLRGH